MHEMLHKFMVQTTLIVCIMIFQNMQYVCRRITEKSREIEALFAKFGVMEIQPVKSSVSAADLSGTEIALVAICCFIFFGADIVIVVICISWRQYVEPN